MRNTGGYHNLRIGLTRRYANLLFNLQKTLFRKRFRKVKIGQNKRMEIIRIVKLKHQIKRNRIELFIIILRQT